MVLTSTSLKLGQSVTSRGSVHFSRLTHIVASMGYHYFGYITTMELQLLWILLESCSCLSTRCKQNCLPSEFGSSINYRSWSDCVYPIPVLTLPGTNIAPENGWLED